MHRAYDRNLFILLVKTAHLACSPALQNATLSRMCRAGISLNQTTKSVLLRHSYKRRVRAYNATGGFVKHTRTSDTFSFGILSHATEIKLNFI